MASRQPCMDLLTPLGTGIQDVHGVLISQTKQCSYFITQNTKPMSQDGGIKNEWRQETWNGYKTASSVIPKVINLCSQGILTKLAPFFCRKID